MAKLVLLSVVIMLFMIPLTVGRARNPRRSLRKMLVYALLFNLFYYFALRFIYPRLL